MDKPEKWTQWQRVHDYGGEESTQQW